MGRFEDIIFRVIPVWLYLITIIFFVFFAASIIYVTYNLDDLSRKVPKFTKPVETTLVHFDSAMTSVLSFFVNGFSNPRILKVDYPTGIFFDNNTNLKGYVLVSAYEPSIQQSRIYLYDLENKTTVWTWDIALNTLNEKISDKYKKTEYDYTQNFRAQHPILTDDGGLIVSSGEGLLAKFDIAGRYQWHNERHFHHSIERGIKDNTFISQIITLDKPRLPNGNLLNKIRNDGYVVFDDEGKILEERSVAQILIDNGYLGLLMGTKWQDDRIHLNDAEFIEETDKYVRKGDLMLSSRHLSTVMFYRPSTNKIIWLQNGPFLNQHDIDYLGNGEFMIFGNDNLNFGDRRLVEDYSSLYK